jgi:hypothetical protein
MKTKFTPGPWRVIPKAGGFGPVSILAQLPVGISIGHPVAYPGIGDFDEVEAANAQLVAAAPELLEALKDAVAFIGNLPAGSGGFQAYVKAMEIIDRAEGRP